MNRAIRTNGALDPSVKSVAGKLACNPTNSSTIRSVSHSTSKYLIHCMFRGPSVFGRDDCCDPVQKLAHFFVIGNGIPRSRRTSGTDHHGNSVGKCTEYVLI